MHGALRRLFLRRVAREAVVLGEVRQHHLRVALGAERAWRGSGSRVRVRAGLASGSGSRRGPGS
eukprot:scaffold108818_cov57-Phaeocystis_antarctica.AAC.1